MSLVNPQLEEAYALSTLKTLQVAHEQIRLATDAVKSAKDVLNEAARRYLMESPEDELLNRAAYVYWHLSDVPAAVIASVVVGDSKNVQKLLSLLPAEILLDVKCASCGGDIDIKSREALKQVGRWGPPICKACQEIEQRHRYGEYESQEESKAKRLQVLRTMPYLDYLLTEEWLETRNRKLKQAHFSCQLCGSGGLLDVHHRTYERRGHEDMADLIVLCHSCHGKFHGKLP
jgi:hypothetical protein